MPPIAPVLLRWALNMKTLVAKFTPAQQLLVCFPCVWLTKTIGLFSKELLSSWQRCCCPWKSVGAVSPFDCWMMLTECHCHLLQKACKSTWKTLCSWHHLNDVSIHSFKHKMGVGNCHHSWLLRWVLLPQQNSCCCNPLLQRSLLLLLPSKKPECILQMVSDKVLQAGPWLWGVRTTHHLSLVQQQHESPLV